MDRTTKLEVFYHDRRVGTMALYRKQLAAFEYDSEWLLNTDTSENLDYLFAKGASSGGARPKILTKVEDEDWMIKFPSSEDSRIIGQQG